jgi:uncharacterized alpha-E superfamily protein
VQRSLHEITTTPRGTWCNGAERSLGRLSSQLGYLTIEDVIETGLHEFLDRMQIQINQVGNELATTFFGLELCVPSLGNSQSQIQIG